MKSQATGSEKIFAKQNSDKGLYLEYIKNSLKSRIGKQITLKVWTKYLKRHYTKEDI